MNRLGVAGVLGVLALLPAGCARETQKDLEVGVHRVSIAADPGWRHTDQGQRHRLQRGEVYLVLEDLGPVERQGIRREVEYARDLWRRGQEGEARTRFDLIRVSKEHFVTQDQRQAFWLAWHEVSRAPEGLDTAAVMERFDHLLDAVAALRERAPEDVIDDALERLGEDERRSEASRVIRRLEGRELVIVETWNRLSHAEPRRFALLRDGGYLLALHTERGPWPAAGAVFDRVARSLRLVRPAG